MTDICQMLLIKIKEIIFNDYVIIVHDFT